MLLKFGAIIFILLIFVGCYCIILAIILILRCVMGNERSDEAIFADMLDGFRVAVMSGDKREIMSSANNFIKIWNKDSASNMFYNMGIFREFCGLLAIGLGVSQDIVLDRDNIEMLKFLPEGNILNKKISFAKKQDSYLLNNYTDWLIREKRYDQLVDVAGINEGEQFDKVQNCLIAQHDDPAKILDFVLKYGERANLPKISRSICDYAGALSHCKTPSAVKKYKEVYKINLQIADINREYMAKKAIESIENQFRR